MIINISSAPVTGAAKGDLRLESASAPLEQGDSLEVKVLFNDKGVVTMKTESGQIVRARLEGDAQLSPGSTATLKVTDVTADAIRMTIQTAEDFSLPQKIGLQAKAMEQALSAFTEKLSQLRLPESRETAEAMRNMMAANPTMTMDEAAFLASNKIAPDSPLAEAARALIEDGVKIDGLIQSMKPLLEGTGESPAKAAETVVNLSAQTAAAETGDAPLTKWLSGVLDSQSAQKPAIPTQGDSAAPAQSAPGQEPVFTAAANPGAGATAAETASAFRTQTFDSAKQAVMNLLSEIPEFRDTPARALSNFSERLLGAAAKAASAPGGSDEAEKLKALLDGVFEKLPSGDEKGGEVIRRAKDDLYMRLTLFEEALKSSDAPSKTALLKETENLLNHVKLQNNIDQFVYMQLPIKLGDENKTADLYVYKQRKGAKSVDPENISILLALDLEHMGHIESFVKIRGREVSIQAEVPSETSKAFFSENIVKLHELLSEINFRLTGINVSCSKDVTTPLTALISLLSHEKRPAAGIDYTV